VAVLVALVIVTAAQGRPANAQNAQGNASLEGEFGWIDAVLATPNYKTPVSPDDILATALGVEEATPRPQFNLNILAPVWFNSNTQFLTSGGTSTMEGSPIVRVAGASQLFGTPLRISGAASAEFERFVDAKDAAVDYFRSSARIQYINLGNDQGFSPFISYAPRMDFDPTFAHNFATRQDLNLGIDKVFNFDDRFNRVPVSSHSAALSAFFIGFSTGLQWRFRSPSPASGALFLNPSAGYIFSEHWNASLSTFTTRRWFESTNGVARRDWLVEPTGILEFIIPSAWLGGADMARLLGRPALDSVASVERNWSSVSSGAYTQWRVGLVLKVGLSLVI
jgi:hypothetical protein